MQTARRIGRGLRNLTHWSERAGAYAAKQLGLHASDLSCLGMIYNAGKPVSAKQVSDYMGLSSGSATALVDRLEAAGYVRRIPNPADRRGVLIELDAQRAAEPISYYQRLQVAYIGVFEEFSDEELAVVARFFDSFDRKGAEIGESLFPEERS
jgi:DNA-binding MarR family transcriptional regulator